MFATIRISLISNYSSALINSFYCSINIVAMTVCVPSVSGKAPTHPLGQPPDGAGQKGVAVHPEGGRRWVRRRRKRKLRL